MRGQIMGSLGQAYSAAYGALCGVHPRRNIAHFQWLSTRDLYRDLRAKLPMLKGRVLDIGCGSKPYASWLVNADLHVGMDTNPGPFVDVVVPPGRPWPMETGTFDAALCTQVLQYVKDPTSFMGELYRVLRPGGILVITVPFSYNLHAVLEDFWRYSGKGISTLLGDNFQIAEIVLEGNLGTFIGVPLLNWMDTATNRNVAFRTIKAFALPVWALFCVTMNLFFSALNLLDKSGTHFTNVFVLARKI